MLQWSSRVNTLKMCGSVIEMFLKFFSSLSYDGSSLHRPPPPSLNIYKRQLYLPLILYLYILYRKRVKVFAKCLFIFFFSLKFRWPLFSLALFMIGLLYSMLCWYLVPRENPKSWKEAKMFCVGVCKTSLIIIFTRLTWLCFPFPPTSSLHDYLRPIDRQTNL